MADCYGDLLIDGRSRAWQRRPAEENASELLDLFDFYRFCCQQAGSGVTLQPLLHPQVEADMVAARGHPGRPMSVMGRNELENVVIWCGRIVLRNVCLKSEFSALFKKKKKVSVFDSCTGSDIWFFFVKKTQIKAQLCVPLRTHLNPQFTRFTYFTVVYSQGRGRPLIQFWECVSERWRSENKPLGKQRSPSFTAF